MVRLVALLLVLAGGTAAQAAELQRAPWRTVGHKSVGIGIDRDTIPASGSARDREMRLCLLNRPIEIHRIILAFGNGTRREHGLHHMLQPGTCTAAKELHGRHHPRVLQSVELIYAPLKSGVRPMIRVEAR